jgi:ribosome recycling factor
MIDEILFDAEEKMEKAISFLKEELSRIRTGRASAHMFHGIVVDYYDTMTPIVQLAGFAVPEPRMCVITPYDKNSLGVIERAIRDSDLGVNPTNDGTVIRVNFPQLTEERRREFIKVARHKAEDAKVSIRNIRRKAKDELDKLVKDGKSGEDDVVRAEKELDKITSRHVDHVDELLRHKEAELLEV